MMPGKLSMSVLLALAMLAGACGSETSTTTEQPSPGDVSATATGDEGDSADPGGEVLRVAYDWDLTTGDPAGTGSTGDVNLLINILDPLTQRDDEGNLQPALATEWELLNDDLTWRFKLREGVKFHNGEDFNADSVKFSLERILNDPKSPSSTVRSLPVESIDVIDPLTVDINTSEPVPQMPATLALFGGLMVPPGYIEENGADHFASNPVGTGPFMVEDWTRGSEMNLTANDDYWGEAPQVEAVQIRFIGDPTTRVAALLNNEVDLINAVPTSSAARIADAGGFELDVAEGLRIFYASLAQPDGPLADADVRRALSHAVNYEALIENLMLGYAKPIAAPVASTNYGADVPISPYEYDVEKAKSLLEEAGYPDGFEIDFDTHPGIYQDIAQALSQMWAEIGVDVNLEVMTEAQFEDLYDVGELTGIWNSGYTMWQGDPTVLMNSFFRSGMDRAKYHSPELDEMIDTLKTTTDPDERRQTMHEALTLLHEDAPWVYLFQAADLYGRSDGVSWTVPNLQLLRLNTVSLS